MSDLLSCLETNQILYAKNVADIKACIGKVYPSASPQHAAELFAKAVHQIINQSLYPFNEDISEQLRHELLRLGLQKKTFSLNGRDLFEACVTSKITKEHYIPPLTSWVKKEFPDTFTEHEIINALSVIAAAHSSKATTPTLSAPLPVSSAPASESSAAPYNSTFWKVLIEQGIQHKRLIAGLLTVFLFISGTSYFYMQHTASKAFALMYEAVNSISISIPSPSPTPDAIPIVISEAEYLKPELQYKEIDKKALQEWLDKRNSLLAEEPYFSHIIDSAASYNINPLLMFAITGQEQGFVPRTHEEAGRIANNPFNVYGSWKDFNTDIKDTSQIAARTIITLSQNCPKEEDPIKWLNKKYAEDPNWHLGVSSILAQLEDVAGTPAP